MNSTKQKVWKSMSTTGHSGYFLWEVIEAEVIGNVFKDKLVECRDGSYILVMPPWHYWSKESAIEALFTSENVDFYETVIITGMPDLTLSEYKEFLKLED